LINSQSSKTSPNNSLIPIAHAAAEAALLPTPYPAGTPFFILTSIPFLYFIPRFTKSFIIAFPTNPAVFFFGSSGMSSELTIVIPFPFFVTVTSS
jgi:hypothetical protein